jgi:ribonuclease P protein component
VLSSQHRINRGEDFRRILRTGRKSRSALGTVAIADSASTSFRCGVITSKAVGGAVVRNRVRRRVRAALASLAPALAGKDVVVRCGQEAAELSYHEIFSLIEAAIERSVRA